MKRKAPTTEPIIFRVPVEWKDRVRKAAGVRDGDNISRLVRRAVDRLIEEERLLDTDEQDAA